VTVEKNATLSKIARANYGDAAAWRCIAKANPQILDANRIYEGQQLLLPFNCKQ
jgi:nucleoid-associated protein YgaU